ncbi:unnamed protein product [Cuscuta europaea]|uniref:Uncharacterized protein n=1 Tax=Cuscuta europaea TaxID=41803 RepID=A0A9P1EB82_CUSEU|nr:unnamed protein product [Cuscuta europaea]
MFFSADNIIHPAFNLFYQFVGLIGLFCPCVLFGRNVESLNEEISQAGACGGHIICVEGGIMLAVATAAMHGIDPDTMCLITEGLLFTWWVCGIYTGMARQALQRKYHLKVIQLFINEIMNYTSITLIQS